MERREIKPSTVLKLTSSLIQFKTTLEEKN